MWGLLLAAQNFTGINATGMNITDVSQLQPYDIVLLNFNGNYHWSIIKAVTGNMVYLMDTNLGNIQMTMTQFISYYTGYVLIISKTGATIQRNGTVLSDHLFMDTLVGTELGGAGDWAYGPSWDPFEYWPGGPIDSYPDPCYDDSYLTSDVLASVIGSGGAAAASGSTATAEGTVGIGLSTYLDAFLAGELIDPVGGGIIAVGVVIIVAEVYYYETQQKNNNGDDISIDNPDGRMDYPEEVAPPPVTLDPLNPYTPPEILWPDSDGTFNTLDRNKKRNPPPISTKEKNVIVGTSKIPESEALIGLGGGDGKPIKWKIIAGILAAGVAIYGITYFVFNPPKIPGRP